MRGPLLQLLHSLILHRRRVPLSCPLHFLANFFFPKSNTLSSAALHGIPSSRPTASHTLSRWMLQIRLFQFLIHFIIPSNCCFHQLIVPLHACSGRDFKEIRNLFPSVSAAFQA